MNSWFEIWCTSLQILWGNYFHPNMNEKQFKNNVAYNSSVVYKTKAEQCGYCKGTGYIRKIKKDGSPYLKQPKCPVCEGSGYLFKPTNKIAGFKFQWYGLWCSAS